MNTKLGVIIPTYDNLDMLKLLVDHLSEFNVYIVEDGNARKEGHIKEETVEWLKQQKGITCVYHEENQGVAISWNDGLKAAMEDNCTHFAILNDDVVLPRKWWSECKKLFKDDVHLISLDTNCFFSGWFFIIDKVCIDEIGLFDESVSLYGGEDDEYWERYSKTGFKKGIVDINVWHYGSKTIKKIEKSL